MFVCYRSELHNICFWHIFMNNAFSIHVIFEWVLNFFGFLLWPYRTQEWKIHYIFLLLCLYCFLYTRITNSIRWNHSNKRNNVNEESERGIFFPDHLFILKLFIDANIYLYYFISRQPNFRCLFDFVCPK